MNRTTLKVALVMAGALIGFGGTAAHAETTHSPLVVANCFPLGNDNHAARLVIANNKKYGTAWIRGYQLTATTLHHGTITRTRSVEPFRIRAWHETGWDVRFDPRRISSCSFTILWGTGANG